MTQGPPSPLSDPQGAKTRPPGRALPPPVFPPPRAARPGLFRRSPPAAFAPVLGLLGLGIAWRMALDLWQLPGAPAEALLGASSLLFAFTALAYLAKLARRPGVLIEDLRPLPGRAGLAALVLCLPAMAMVLQPYGLGLARGIWALGAVLWLGQACLMGWLIARNLRGPGVRANLGGNLGASDIARVSPVWHLQFSGLIVFAAAALGLGWVDLAALLFWPAALAAAAIWIASAHQFARARLPAPLRPLLAIHLTPANFLATVALGLGWERLAVFFAVMTLAILIALLASWRWLTAAGFSPLWGAFTFPSAALSKLWLLLAAGGHDLWSGAALAALLGTSLIVPPITYRILQMWAKGTLATRSNAATA